MQIVLVLSADWIKKVVLRLGITESGGEERECQVPSATHLAASTAGFSCGTNWFPPETAQERLMLKGFYPNGTDSPVPLLGLAGQRLVTRAHRECKGRSDEL